MEAEDVGSACETRIAKGIVGKSKKPADMLNED
jgi:hypothetical protein